MNELINAIVAFMMTVSPPGEPIHRAASQETDEAKVQRYYDAAQDMVEVVFSEDEIPLYDGPNGRTHTIATLLGIMRHESRFDLAIDNGIWRGDSGESWCMLQVRAGRVGRTTSWNIAHDRPVYFGDPEEEIRIGVTGREMIQDRRLCIREGLRVARWSFSRCGDRGIYEKLRIYTSGACSRGGEASRERMWSGESLWRRWQSSMQWTDSDVVEGLRRQREAEALRQALEEVMFEHDLGVQRIINPEPEIPWFIELAETFDADGFIGVSID